MARPQEQTADAKLTQTSADQPVSPPPAPNRSEQPDPAESAAETDIKQSAFQKINRKEAKASKEGSRKQEQPASKGNPFAVITEKAWYQKYSVPVMILLAAILAVSAVSSGSAAKALEKSNADRQQQIEELEKENGDLQDQIDEQCLSINRLKEENNELKNGKDKMLVDVRNAYDKKDWSGTVALADKLHEKYNGSQQDQEGQKLKQTAAQKIKEAEEAEKKKQEEEERKRKEEEARGYETGITYDQLARTPDDYIGDKVKFSGKVIQVTNNDDSVSIRLAVDGDYDKVVFGIYEKDLVSSRILEDDVITIYGISAGEYTYKAVLGNSITIPGIAIAKIDQ